MANDQFPDKKAISITGLIGEKIKMFEDHILGKSLKLIKEIDPECILETNFFLAESLIINLIGNAVKHNVNNGVINIICISGINNIISGDSSLTLGMTGYLGGQMSCHSE
jgi:signal transduction histidine kinase